MKYALLYLLILFPTIANAVPARRVQRTVTLPDGTRKTVTLRGDENFHYFQAQDGTLFCEDSEDWLLPASPEHVQAKWQKRATERQAVRPTRSTANVAPKRIATVGKRKGMVVLANFSDRKLSISKSEFEKYFNQQGYSNYGTAGSVHDYFYDNSYGQFDLTFDIYGPVTLSKSIQYYGQNDANGNDMHAAEMVREAVVLAAEPGMDFTQYDWDGDGEVDQVYVIYAGYGESSYAPKYTIWPHEYRLSHAQYYGDGNGPVALDCGVKIDTYACSNELYGTVGKTIDGIGTACHEFSHCLGLPDFYNTTSNNFGMDQWSVMDYGCYGDDGRCPVGYTSYERWWCGWMEPVCLKEPDTITDMPSLNTSPTAYIIYNELRRNEYYLLENRQQDGWHKYDNGHGMLVLHVDYDENDWYMNSVNDKATHQRMTIIPADNEFGTTTTGLAGDPWPGTKKKTELTDSSTPAATLYNMNKGGKKLMGKPITAIQENRTRHTISFKFMGGKEANAISNTPTDRPDTNAGQRTYNLQGAVVPTDRHEKGIHIRGNRKVLTR